MQPTQPVSPTGVSSPFTPTQCELLLAGTGFLVLLAGWQLWQALRSRSRGTAPTRLLPFALVLVTLAIAFETVMILEATAFFVRHIEWMPIPPVIAFFAILVAARYDENHKVITGPEEPSRVDSFRCHLAAVLKTGELQFPRSRTRLLLNHLKNLARFYVGAERLHIVSPYDFDQAMSRIKQLTKAGEVWVLEKPPGKLMVRSTRVRGNVPPLFRGTLIERDGKAVLDGRIEMDAGIVAILGVFSIFLLVIVPPRSLFSPGLAPSDRWSGVFGLLAWCGMLEWIYLVSKEIPAIIIRNLKRALRE